MPDISSNPVLSDLQLPPLVLGVVGAYCAGKSRIVAYLRERVPSLVHIDVDRIGHESYASCLPELVRTFGRGILSTAPAESPTASAVPGERSGLEAAKGSDTVEVDRKKLGGIVFADPQGLQKLEQILHPWMVKEVARRVSEAKGLTFATPGRALIVVDAALLGYMGLHHLCDMVLVVRALSPIRLRRGIKRDHLPPSAVKKRMLSQQGRVPAWTFDPSALQSAHPVSQIAHAQSQTPGRNADIVYVSNHIWVCTRIRLLHILRAFRGGRRGQNPANTAWIKNEPLP